MADAPLRVNLTTDLPEQIEQVKHALNRTRWLADCLLETVGAAYGAILFDCAGFAGSSTVFDAIEAAAESEAGASPSAVDMLALAIVEGWKAAKAAEKAHEGADPR